MWLASPMFSHGARRQNLHREIDFRRIGDGRLFTPLSVHSRLRLSHIVLDYSS